MSGLKVCVGDPEERGDDRAFRSPCSEKKNSVAVCSMNAWGRLKVRSVGERLQGSQGAPSSAGGCLRAASFTSPRSPWNASTCPSWTPNPTLEMPKRSSAHQLLRDSFLLLPLGPDTPAQASIWLVLNNHDSSMCKTRLPLEMLGTLRKPRLSRSWGLHQGNRRCQGEASHSLAATSGLARLPSGRTVLFFFFF